MRPFFLMTSNSALRHSLRNSLDALLFDDIEFGLVELGDSLRHQLLGGSEAAVGGRPFFDQRVHGHNCLKGGEPTLLGLRDGVAMGWRCGGIVVGCGGDEVGCGGDGGCDANEVG